MNKLKLATATGLTSLVVYFSCFLTVSLLGRDSLISLSNLIFHGIDFTTIIRTEISFFETCIGSVVSFLFWGLLGYILAVIYNKLK